MDRDQRQLRRRELARREFIERLRRAPIIARSDWTEETDEGTGEAIRVPRVAEVGGGFGLVADLGDSCVVHLPKVVDIAGLRGVATLDAANLDFDKLLPPYADRTLGHFSYAHTEPYHTDDFSVAADPWTSSPNWTETYGDYYLERQFIGSGELRADLGNSKSLVWCYNTNCDMSGVGADYSVEVQAVALGGSNNNETYGGPMGRMDTGNTQFYWLKLRNIGPSYGGTKLYLYRRKSSTTTTIGTYDMPDVSVASGLLRLEMVGQAIKGYLDGTLRIDVSDPLPNGVDTAGYAGLGVRRGYNLGYTDYWPRMDDYAVYVEAATTGSPATLSGPLAGRGQLNFGLAR